VNSIIDNEEPRDHGNEAEFPASRQSTWRSDAAVLIYIACATIVVHLLTGGRYGFHRDELATLDDARHLSWGYVAYPPITPFLLVFP